MVGYVFVEVVSGTSDQDDGREGSALPDCGQQDATPGEVFFALALPADGGATAASDNGRPLQGDTEHQYRWGYTPNGIAVPAWYCGPRMGYCGPRMSFGYLPSWPLHVRADAAACARTQERENFAREAALAKSKVLALLSKAEHRSAEELALDCIARMEVEALQALPNSGPPPEAETLSVATETVEVGKRTNAWV